MQDKDITVAYLLMAKQGQENLILWSDMDKIKV